MEAARQKRLKKIAADPDKLVAEVRKLVKLRSTSEYERAARELADLREALGPEAGPPCAGRSPKNSACANPTLKLLVAALRKQGLLG